MTGSVKDNRKFKCKTCGAIYHFETAFETAQGCRVCGDVNYEQIRITLVCDFCSTAENVNWTYPCHDFIAKPLLPVLPDEAKIGPWAACNECHALIEKGDWEAVADRATANHPSAQGLSERHRRVLRKLLLALHKQFQENRAGTAYRHKEDDK